MVRTMASAKENLGERVSPDEQSSEPRKPLDEHVVQTRCNVPSQHCEQYSANLCRLPFPTRNVRSISNQNTSARAQAARGCAARVFGHVPQPQITRVFQNPKHASTMEQVCDGSTGGNNFGRARSEIIPATHFTAETCCRIQARTRTFLTSYLTKLRVQHIPHANPNDSSLLPRSQIHRTLHANTFQSRVCEPLDLQSLCQQSLGTLRECFLFRSGRKRVVPC